MANPIIFIGFRNICKKFGNDSLCTRMIYTKSDAHNYCSRSIFNLYSDFFFKTEGSKIITHVYVYLTSSIASTVRCLSYWHALFMFSFHIYVVTWSTSQFASIGQRGDRANDSISKQYDVEETSTVSKRLVIIQLNCARAVVVNNRI